MSTDKGVRVWLRRHGAEPDRELFASWAPLASEQVVGDARRVLQP